MRTVLKFALIALLLVGVERFCHHATGSFAIEKISSSHTPRHEWEVPTSFEEIQMAKKILSQDFRYLEKGAQAYVFASEDNKYVLKFFRHSHMRPPFWIDLLPSNTFKKLCDKRKQKGYGKLNEDFASYTLAFNEMKNETGLIFLHLNKTKDLKQKIKFYDKIGIYHELDADKMEFILQKKATLVFSAIKEWMSNNKVEEAKEGISNLIDLLLLRLGKRIYDKDPDLGTNFAFNETKALQIDVGRFKINPAESVNFENEIMRITDVLNRWLKKNYPELGLYLDDIILEKTGLAKET